jgi:hypothetical protein
MRASELIRGVTGAMRPLGLTGRDWPKGRERAVFIADHALYGFVVSERS